MRAYGVIITLGAQAVDRLRDAGVPEDVCTRWLREWRDLVKKANDGDYDLGTSAGLMLSMLASAALIQRSWEDCSRGQGR